jgi:DNA-binding NarL/FixJ family response regulator
VTRPRVLLADDHTMVAQGLSSILEPEYELVGIAKDGRELVSEYERLRPDLVVTDITMPMLNGLEAARKIKQLDPAAKIIFLTMHLDSDFAAAAFELGASGYLLKHSAVEELKTALHQALMGRVYITPRIAAEVLSAMSDARTETSPSTGPLTPRQREVLQLVAEGESNKQIATTLGVSIKTVEHHKHNIKKKLRLKTTAELTRYAIRQGLISV